MTEGPPSVEPRLNTLRTRDGYDLRYRVWPSVRAPAATLVMLNGIMSHSAWFEPLAAPLAQAGYAMVGADRRGSGPNRPGWGDAVSAGSLVDDVVEVLEQQQRPGVPVVLVGWCWGAALSVAVTAKLEKVGRPSAGLILVTPGMWNRPALHEAVEAQRAAIEAAEPAACVVVSPIRSEMFTRGPALQSFVETDPDRVGVITPRMLAVTAKLVIAAQVRLRKLVVPTLVVLASEDEATDNDATCTFFDGLPRPGPTVVTVPGAHGVQFDAPDAVVGHIARWLASHLEARA